MTMMVFAVVKQVGVVAVALKMSLQMIEAVPVALLLAVLTVVVTVTRFDLNFLV